MSIPTLTEILASTISKAQKTRIIDLTDSLPDITYNLIRDTEHSDIPSDEFEDFLFWVVNDLIDDVAQNTEQYLKPHHKQALDQIAAEYRQSNAGDMD